LIKARKKYLYDEDKIIDIGYVGEVVKINTQLLGNILKGGIVPVISPIGYDKEGNKYNINADYAASFVSSALNAEKLLILTDTEGVYMNVNDKSSLISCITVDEIKQYINEGIINGGMIPKMECCMEAIKNGTDSVHLIDGRKEHSVIFDIINNSGTKIITKEEDSECQKVI
jgi:acetylglutamate kinase